MEQGFDDGVEDSCNENAKKHGIEHHTKRYRVDDPQLGPQRFTGNQRGILYVPCTSSVCIQLTVARALQPGNIIKCIIHLRRKAEADGLGAPPFTWHRLTSIAHADRK